jgi:hypothetical protein
VLGKKVTRTPKPPTQVLGEKTVRTPNALPFTGAEIGLMTGVALLALGAGSVLLVAARRRRPQQH